MGRRKLLVRLFPLEQTADLITGQSEDNQRVDPLSLCACSKLRLYSSSNFLCRSNVAFFFIDIMRHEKSENISGNRMLEQGKAKSIITHLPSQAKLCSTKYLLPQFWKLHSVNRPVRIWGSLPLSTNLSQGQKTTTISRCSRLWDTDRMTERIWGGVQLLFKHLLLKKGGLFSFSLLCI